jgi:hypothetical protein
LSNEANGRDGGIGELTVAQTDAAQGIDENAGRGRERHAQLIGLHGGRRGAIGEQQTARQCGFGLRAQSS